MSATLLSGKRAVITGGGSGIGRATALRFAEEGAEVTIVDLNLDAATQTADLIGASGRGAGHAVRADVTSATSMQDAIAEAERAFGSVHVLSCNAGLAMYPTAADETTEQDFDRVFAVNVKGVWNSVRAAIPSMRRSGGGSVIITGSIMGERTRPGQSIYAASKAAANHLARSFALDLAPDGIRVNCLAPVATDTAMLPMFLGPDHPEEARKAFVAGIPLGRLAQPTDVAAAALYLASDDAAFITGVVLPVDGGRSV